MTEENRLVQDLKDFYKEIKSLLLCSSAKKEDILLGLQGDIEEYIEHHPEAGIEDIKTKFGTAEVIANSYQFSIGETEVRQKIKKKKTFWCIGAAVIFILFVISVILIVIYYKKSTADLPVYYVITEEIIEGSIPEELLNDPNAVTK